MNATHIWDALNALCYEEQAGCYTGKVKIDGVSISLILCPHEEDDLELALRSVRQMLADFGTHSCRTEAYAVQALLPLENEHWLEDLGEDEDLPLTAEQFTSRMMLESLVFDPDGDVTFYDDDELPRDTEPFRTDHLRLRERALLPVLPGQTMFALNLHWLHHGGVTPDIAGLLSQTLYLPWGGDLHLLFHADSLVPGSFFTEEMGVHLGLNWSPNSIKDHMRTSHGAAKRKPV